MFNNAKYGVVALTGGEMEYVRFGNGQRTLVMLPGLGESLRSLKGMALPMALLYRCFSGAYTVYVLSRKRPVAPGTGTRDMARDVAQAMDMLKLPRADLVGVSMGGMISQFLAADFPEKVGKLVLAVTCPCPNPTLESAVGQWQEFAEQGDHRSFMDSNLRLIYSDDYCRKNGWMVPILGILTKPKSYTPFLIQAVACRTHDAREVLGKIKAETLVIGGGKDKTLGGEASRELASQIPGAQLYMYDGWGHGLYEEAPDFNGRVLEFLLR